MNYLNYLIVLYIALLASCTTHGPTYSEIEQDIQPVADGKARIFVLRTHEKSLYWARSAPIKIDDKKVSSCPKGAFVYFDVDVTKQQISTEAWDYPGECSFYITPEAGENYYFEVMPRDDSYGPGTVGVIFGGMLGSTIFGAIESSGTQCGGMFALFPLEKDDALEKVKYLQRAE